jgi:hypothetical protein
MKESKEVYCLNKSKGVCVMRFIVVVCFVAICLGSCTADPEPAITFTNKLDHPIARAELSYRHGPVNWGSSIKPRVKVAVYDLMPGETKRMIPKSFPEGTVRITLE